MSSQPWPNDNWTRVEVYRLVYGHLPSHTCDTITKKTLESFVHGVREGRILSSTIDVEEIKDEIEAGRFLTTSRLVKLLLRKRMR